MKERTWQEIIDLFFDIEYKEADVGFGRSERHGFPVFDEGRMEYIIESITPPKERIFPKGMNAIVQAQVKFLDRDDLVLHMFVQDGFVKEVCDWWFGGTLDL